jgi:transcriptional regulator with XRE-family HTH domain
MRPVLRSKPLSIEDAIRDWVRAQMTAQGVTQKDLAERLGITQSAMSFRLAKASTSARSSSLSPDGWARTVGALGGRLVVDVVDDQASVPVSAPAPRASELASLARLDSESWRLVMTALHALPHLSERDRFLVEVLLLATPHAPETRQG